MNTLYSVLDLFSEVWVWLALVAAVGYALVGFIDEHLLSEVSEDTGVKPSNGVGNLVLISGFFGITILLAFGGYAYYVDGFQSLWIESSLRWQAVIAGALEVVWLIPYLYAVNRSGTMNVAPIFQAIPIFVLVIGGVFFGEIPTTLHVIGSFTIIIGSFILNSGSMMEGIQKKSWVKMLLTAVVLTVIFVGPVLLALVSVISPTVAAVAMGLIALTIFFAFVKAKAFKVDVVTIALTYTACGIIAAVYFLIKEVINEGSFVAASFWNAAGMTVFTTVVAVVWTPYRKQFIRFLKKGSRKAIGIMAANEFVNTVSVLASHLANALAPSVMLAATFNCFHPIFTLIIGWLRAVGGSKKHREQFKGKGSTLKLVVAVVLIATGTVIVSL